MFTLNLKQMISKSLAAALLVAVAIPSLASAAIVKPARPNDTSAGYELINGTLYRLLSTNNRFNPAETRPCAITNGVLNFKVATHPFDVAAVYFKRIDGSVYYMNMSDLLGWTGNCPSTAGKVKVLPDMVGGVKEYGVISHQGTQIVNYALRNDGLFRAWGNSRSIVQTGGIVDVMQNTCYGRPGLPYSSKVLFLKNVSGQILAVEENGNTVVQPGAFASISDFKRVRNVCNQNALGGSSVRVVIGGAAK